MKKYEVSVGQEFQIATINVDNAQPVLAAAHAAETISRARVRGRLAFLVTGAIALSLVVSATLGYVDGTYNEVDAVWERTQFILGYVLATYFATGPPTSS